ncbi:isoprenylcysteine carboxylmethyltransferase family protein [uncultured Sphingomonas sp.]|uniref:isoprenylcysteine carboxyl methyltransferase family protein n=1 Tax=uncultured Sphingomonas sp. TaxID=158754 RepID=UPI0025E2A384|nr:isoprenylcysteine carboxylmethyltransferase family protein [uncultured Sphingomonas sp.]
MTLPYAIMAFVTLQRLSELVIARRNTARLMAAGAREYGAGHYPVMVAMHTAWLIALWFSVGDRTVSWPLLLIFAVLQGMRIWVLATLGPRWTTRIIVLPGASLVARGPFRFLRHPNYAVVTAEIAVLPLTFGLVGIAALFTVLNAAMLYVRIGAENRALGLSAGS